MVSRDIGLLALLAIVGHFEDVGKRNGLPEMLDCWFILDACGMNTVFLLGTWRYEVPSIFLVLLLLFWLLFLIWGLEAA